MSKCFKGEYNDKNNLLTLKHSRALSILVKHESMFHYRCQLSMCAHIPKNTAVLYTLTRADSIGPLIISNLVLLFPTRPISHVPLARG